MSDEEGPMDNWKQFQGTELGGLLGSIYGNQNRPKINYPKPKQRAPVEKKDFIPGGAKSEAVDPRKATRKAVTIAVPKLSGRTESEQENIKPIDIIPKRKNLSAIQVELDDIRMRQEHYRPAHVRPIHSEAEKDRLSQVFTHKGGKGLPEGLTLPISEAPFEIETRNREKERWNNIRRKRGQLTIPAPKAAISDDEMLARQIQAEIEERTQYIEEMRQLNALQPAQERTLKRELQQRVVELNRLLSQA